MISMEITDIKEFTTKLFVGEMFDSFLLCEASFVTRAACHIDGHLQMSYFDTDEQKLLTETGREFNFWKEMKPECRHLIRGKRLPVRFQIVFQCPDRGELLSDFPDLSTDAARYYLNVRYQNPHLTCTTGISSLAFIPGIRPDHLWDETLLRFFQKNNIPCALR